MDELSFLKMDDGGEILLKYCSTIPSNAKAATANFGMFVKIPSSQHACGRK